MRALGSTDHCRLLVGHKVALLTRLCDECFCGGEMRELLAANLERRAEYIAQDAKVEAERKKVAELKKPKKERPPSAEKQRKKGTSPLGQIDLDEVRAHAPACPWRSVHVLPMCPCPRLPPRSRTRSLVAGAWKRSHCRAARTGAEDARDARA